MSLKLKPQNRSKIEVINPATGRIVKTYPIGDKNLVNSVVSSAIEGFQIWKKTSTEERAKIMRLAANLVRSKVEQFVVIISEEMGKTHAQARSETMSVADLINYFAEEGLRVMGEVPKMDLSNELPLILKEPIGVVGAITPFNYPLALLTWKLGPALITGCSLISKPDEHAPTSAILLREIFLEAGLPENVFHVITGNADTGRLIVNHPGINKIAFTGSIKAGNEVSINAARTGKRVTLS
ncbi:MAG: aldehyde dehydrogenase family protein [Flavobacteriaceae bacterium]|nr:aldehyde dehydrogenase family protein [Flavobacteriaceae bacterium]